MIRSRRIGVPEIPPQQDDPITSRPMSLLVLISVFLLLLTVAWSLYSEFFGLRPWRDYQDRFRDVYSVYLEKQIASAASRTSRLSTPRRTIKKLKAAVDAAADGRAARPTTRSKRRSICSIASAPPSLPLSRRARQGRRAHLPAGTDSRERQERQSLQAQGTERRQGRHLRRRLARRNGVESRKDSTTTI